MVFLTDSVRITSDTQITPSGAPAYLRAWVLRSNDEGYRSIEFRDGGSSGTIKWLTHAASYANETVTEFALPGNGILFPNGIYADVSGGSITGAVMFTRET